MKRFLLLLLALACVLSMVACDTKQSSKKDKDNDEDQSIVESVENIEDIESDNEANGTLSEETDEDVPTVSLGNAKLVADGFLKALSKLNAEELKTYCHESAIFTSKSFLEYENLCSGNFEGMLGENESMFAGHEEKLREMVQAIIDNMANSISYELSEGRQTGDDTFTFDTKLIMFDSQTADTAFEQQLANAMTQEKLMELVTELMNNGTITESSTEEELYAVLIPTILDIAIEAIQNVKLPTQTISGKLTVNVKNGALLVDLDHKDTPGIFS